jgi:RNA polymerase sigma-70 factor (ECF subfamily)
MRTTPLASFRRLFGITDEQAMWRVQAQDDPEAFARLVERWEEPIQRLCTRITGDPHRAEDLTQETFARIYARRADYRAGARFSTWLWRIALNLCYDDLRRTRRRGETALEPEPDDATAPILATPAAAPDDASLARETGDLVRAALQRLPEPLRSVLVLRHYEDLKFREIAEVLGIPEGTVKSRTVEALTRLGALLRPALAADAAPARHAGREPRTSKVV